MNWYAAHVLVVLRAVDAKQDVYPVMENVLLIRDVDSARAWEQAKARAMEYETDAEGTQRLEDGRPAKWVFLGIRKLIACDADGDSLPNGTEVTYSQFSVGTEQQLAALSAGEAVEVCYEE